MSKKIDMAASADDHVGPRDREAARPAGSRRCLPTLVTVMVIVRRILINRIYEGKDSERARATGSSCCACPVPDGGVLVLLRLRPI